ncbi:alpha/beta hydrolase fold protein [Cryptococcus neoformans]|nr:alpha/beta hydrolase fold protein [Cryptococcus neoformans var. grubii]OXC61582.1 alpha/beta hydrolase fold protein [Cryptococcus neoformans var. grubii MW-RSA852]
MAQKTFDTSRWTTGKKHLHGTPSTPDEVRYYYIDCLPSPSTPKKGTILLIHGFPETSFQWRHIITPLSNEGYRVIAPDYRGAGHSSKPRGLEGYTKASIAADMVNLLELLGVCEKEKEKVHVIGQDIGGMIAHSFASRYPQMTASVMLGECPQPGTNAYSEICHDDDLWHFTFHQQGDLPELLIAGKEREYLSHFYNRLSNRNEVWTPDVLDFYEETFSQSGAIRCGLDLYRAFHMDHMQNYKFLRDNGKCNVPACALFGSESALLRVGQKQTEELYQDVTIVTVEGSGHWTASENPVDFVDKVIEYISHH